MQQVRGGFDEACEYIPRGRSTKTRFLSVYQNHLFSISIVKPNIKFHTSIPNFCFAVVVKKSLPGDKNFSCEANAACDVLYRSSS